MTALSEFLLERIGEDEAVLTQGEPIPHWTHLSDAVGTFGPRCPTCRGGLWGGRTRALAECAFKRVIVRLWDETEEGTYGDQGPGVAAEAAYALAAVFADHPDFRPEWSAHALT